MNTIATFIKEKRKEAGLTQEEFAARSGLGLRFVRELEQGKETVRMDKVNQALAVFDMEAVPGARGRFFVYSLCKRGDNSVLNVFVAFVESYIVDILLDTLLLAAGAYH